MWTIPLPGYLKEFLLFVPSIRLPLIEACLHLNTSPYFVTHYFGVALATECEIPSGGRFREGDAWREGEGEGSRSPLGIGEAALLE